MDKTRIEKISSALSALSGITSIAGIDIVSVSPQQTTVLASKKFSDDFTPVPVEAVIKNGELQKSVKAGEPVYFQDKNDEGAACHVCVIPLFIEEVSVYFVAQAKSQIFETDGAVLVLAGRLIAASGDMLFGTAQTEDARYKDELMKMRNAQARLFPKFDNIPGLDISAVYLPTDLMTGTFLDAFHISKDVYQIVTCDIIGNDASSSFAGAAVRTLVRSYSSGATMPSALIELIENRVSKIISGVQSLLFLSVYQINQRTGKAIISSYGEINTIFYSKTKKGHIHVNNTQTGQNLAKKVVFKDISMMLEPGDSLLFYTRGVKNAANEDGQTYGENRIITNFKSNIDLSSRDMIHSLTETIYEFTNYSNPSADIILMCIRKT